MAKPTLVSEHLLPQRMPPLLKAISGADARLMDAPTEIIRLSKSVDNCPLHLLPYLAAEWGVDEWDDLWPEDVKRNVVRAAPYVHCKRGTRAAVEAALAALHVNCRLTEWWQASPQLEPHTFQLTAYAGRRLDDTTTALLTPKLYSQIRRTVVRAKRHSQFFSLEVGVGTATKAGLVSRGRALAVKTVPGIASPILDVGTAAGFASRARALSVKAVPATAAPILKLQSVVGAAARARSIQIVRAYATTSFDALAA